MPWTSMPRDTHTTFCLVAIGAGVSLCVALSRRKSRFEACEDSRVSIARSLLTEQSNLRGRLEHILTAFPPTGLYSDEEHLPLGTFATFVTHMQRTLSISPRCKMLESLDSRLAVLFDRDIGHMRELHDLLGLARGTTMAVLAECVKQLPPGRMHHEWSSAVACSAKPNALMDRREEISQGMHRKASRRGLPPPSSTDIDEAVKRAYDAAAGRRRDAAERAAQLAAQLESDKCVLSSQAVGPSCVYADPHR